MRVIIPADRVAEFAADWEADVPAQELAVKYGCARNSISRTAKRLGLPKRRPGVRYEFGPIALTGGAWQPNRRGVQVWVPESVA